MEFTYKDSRVWRNNRTEDHESPFYFTDDGTFKLIWKRLSMLWLNDPKFRMTYPDEVSNTLVMRNTAIVYDRAKNDKAGMAIVSIILNQKFLAGLAEKYSDLVLFTETAGGYVFSKSSFDNPGTVAAIKKESAGKKPYSLLSLGDGRYYLSRAPLFNMGGKTVGTLGVLYGFASVNRVIMVFQAVFFAVMGVAVLIALVTALFTGWRFTQPIIRLNQGAKLIAEGELDQTIDFKTKDEIGELSDSFNTMSRNLKTSFGRIREYNEHLEDMVDQRTKELRAAYEKLLEMDRLKTDFLSNVSHELRTPLTSIIGLNMIVDRQLKSGIFPKLVDSDAKTARTMNDIGKSMELVSRESARLNAIICNLIDLSSMEAGKVKWEVQKVAVEEIIESAVSECTPDLDMKICRGGLTFSKEIEKGLPDIQGDKARLVQLVGNLLSNAVKFTEKGMVALKAARKGGDLVISVADTGVGIESERLQTIFDRFNQGKDIMTGKPRGVGLGLSICKMIAEQHGGRVWAESESGKGSVFYFSLPAS